MQPMWPAPGTGIPGPEWVDDAKNGGYYVLHTDRPDLSGGVAIPTAKPGILAPYQERPHTWPVELKLAFDPRKDAGRAYPLIIALGKNNEEIREKLTSTNEHLSDILARTASDYAHFFDARVRAETPDPVFDQAFAWAELAIDAARVDYHGETGLAAGFYSSGDSARPGFGWFFGRDTLWTLYAANAYGDFQLSRTALEFLIARQRADGKIMHEFSQTADLVDWKSTPYFYASADSTPLLVMVMEDYVNTSGDVAFLRKHWDTVKRAYAFTRAHDSDGDAVYENTEGTGWVESWPPGMPHQEIYLASLDQQSCASMSRLAALMNDADLASAASRASAKIRAVIETKYLDPQTSVYAFSKNADGSLDHNVTIYPSVAWWTAAAGGLPKANEMFRRWASDEISTDWGTRDLSEKSPIYDPISYHQGTVWPLFTGWVSLAEYRSGHSLSGYSHLMQNADMTFTQDLGAVTELLSGEFFQPLGRSSSHQMWSSAMVLSPALRGLFGLDFDALHQTLRLDPHLPAQWDHATLRNLHLGGQVFDLSFRRSGTELVVSATAQVSLCVDSNCSKGEVRIQLPAVEIDVPHGLPSPGSRTAQLKVIAQELTANRFTLEFEAPANTVQEVDVRFNRTGVKVTGGDLNGSRLRIQFPLDAGRYGTRTVTFTW
jgi:glycogen debranching enzyme